MGAGIRAFEKPSLTGFWSDERVETLKRLWRDGLSASEISERMGAASRSAIIGKVHRLKLPTRPQDVKDTNHARSERAKKPGQGGQRERRAPRPPKPRLILAGNGGVIRVPVAPRPRVEIPDDRYSPLPGSTPKVWTERAAGECTWPVGGEGAETLSCCCRVVTHGWCATHLALGVTKAKPAYNKARPDKKIGLNRRFAA
jgi:GcrA cell cycle regulator